MEGVVVAEGGGGGKGVGKEEMGEEREEGESIRPAKTGALKTSPSESHFFFGIEYVRLNTKWQINYSVHVIHYGWSIQAQHCY